jgi:hypothetical protein
MNPCKVAVAITLDAGQDIAGRSAALVASDAVCEGYDAAFNAIKFVTIARRARSRAGKLFTRGRSAEPLSTTSTDFPDA